MKKKIKIFLLFVILLIALSFANCAESGVAVGVGIYVPGAWVGPPHGGYPVGIGYPGYR